jgi:hypothetical protein
MIQTKAELEKKGGASAERQPRRNDAGHDYKIGAKDACEGAGAGFGFRRGRHAASHPFVMRLFFEAKTQCMSAERRRQSPDYHRIVSSEPPNRASLVVGKPIDHGADRELALHVIFGFELPGGNK